MRLGGHLSFPQLSRSYFEVGRPQSDTLLVEHRVNMCQPELMKFVELEHAHLLRRRPLHGINELLRWSFSALRSTTPSRSPNRRRSDQEASDRPIVGCKDGRRSAGGDGPAAASRLTLERAVPAKSCRDRRQLLAAPNGIQTHSELRLDTSVRHPAFRSKQARAPALHAPLPALARGRCAKTLYRAAGWGQFVTRSRKFPALAYRQPRAWLGLHDQTPIFPRH